MESYSKSICRAEILEKTLIYPTSNSLTRELIKFFLRTTKNRLRNKYNSLGTKNKKK